MGLPALTYLLVTIGLIAICIFLISILVVPKLGILQIPRAIYTVTMRLNDTYDIVIVEVSTEIPIKSVNPDCTIAYEIAGKVYVVCLCNRSREETINIKLYSNGRVVTVIPVKC